MVDENNTDDAFKLHNETDTPAASTTDTGGGGGGGSNRDPFLLCIQSSAGYDSFLTYMKSAYSEHHLTFYTAVQAYKRAPTVAVGAVNVR